MSVMRALIAILCLTACAASTTERLQTLYRESLEPLDTGWSAEQVARHEELRDERITETLDLHAAGSVRGSDDQLYAAAILAESQRAEDLELACELALSAAEAGDERGLRLAAEAIDRRCMVLGEAQRFGTQYVFSPITERWDLYPWDPITTDTERAAMGVAPLAQALARLEELNPTTTSSP